MRNRNGIFHSYKSFFMLALALLVFQTLTARAATRVRIDSGIIQGKTSADHQIRIFQGIPFAAPPVGKLRWRAPQPFKPWKGIRKTVAFGPRCMQAARVFSNMIFRDSGPSEDCLYLNVWTPAKSATEKLPVMFWIFGGGFRAGATSEPRQDGTNLAKKGVVVVSCSYRLGIFGFFSYPGLTKESPHHASGDYGLMDQIAALKWVKKNIAAFGGDPANVTIFGESAGSWSVSDLMASPLARGLFQKAIGESGAFFGAGPVFWSPADGLGLAQTEKHGQEFAESIGAKSLAALRAIPANKLLQQSAKANPFRWFIPNIDGYVLPQTLNAIFAEGRQSHVPLLAGWNKDEYAPFFYPPQKRTASILIKDVKARFGPDADKALKFYPHATPAQARQSIGKFVSDLFSVYATWKWLEMQNQTGDSPVYRYLFTRRLPPPRLVSGEAPPTGKYAYHSAEIPYVFGDLKLLKNPWQPVDFKISDAMMTYWSNFAKTGNPNGDGLPHWPRYTPRDRQVMVLGPHIHARHATDQQRLEFIDSFIARYRKQ